MLCIRMLSVGFFVSPPAGQTIFYVHSKNTFALKIDFLIRFSSYLDNIEITGFFFIPVNPRQPNNDKAFGVFKYEENHSQSDVFYVFLDVFYVFFILIKKTRSFQKNGNLLLLSVSSNSDIIRLSRNKNIERVKRSYVNYYCNKKRRNRQP